MSIWAQLHSPLYTSYPLLFADKTVTIGGNEIPIGKVERASVDLDKNIVSIWCRQGAMGMQGPVGLRFHLQTAEKVGAFVKDLLSQTEARLISVIGLKTQFSEGKMSATFEITAQADTALFIAHIAPFYFPDFTVEKIQKEYGTHVVVTSPVGKEDEIVSKMKEAFVNLNTHTSGMIRLSLLDSRGNARWFPFPDNAQLEAMPKKLTVYFEITPAQVKREQVTKLRNFSYPHAPTEHREMKPLPRFEEAKSQEQLTRVQGLVGSMEDVKDAAYKENRAAAINLGQSIIAQGQPTNAVGLEVLTNQAASILPTWCTEAFADPEYVF